MKVGVVYLPILVDLLMQTFLNGKFLVQGTLLERCSSKVLPLYFNLCFQRFRKKSQRSEYFLIEAARGSSFLRRDTIRIGLTSQGASNPRGIVLRFGGLAKDLAFAFLRTSLRLCRIAGE